MLLILSGSLDFLLLSFFLVANVVMIHIFFLLVLRGIIMGYEFYCYFPN